MVLGGGTTDMSLFCRNLESCKEWARSWGANIVEAKTPKKLTPKPAEKSDEAAKSNEGAKKSSTELRNLVTGSLHTNTRP